jgi:hypothetical protein
VSKPAVWAFTNYWQGQRRAVRPGRIAGSKQTIPANSGVDIWHCEETSRTESALFKIAAVTCSLQTRWRVKTLQDLG